MCAAGNGIVYSNLISVELMESCSLFNVSNFIPQNYYAFGKKASPATGCGYRSKENVQMPKIAQWSNK
jgi:hypothetical protein